MSTRLLLALVLMFTGCNAVTHGSRLSDVPPTSRSFFLSTGSAPQKFRTLGFLQIRGYGIEVGGLSQFGDAEFDGPIKKSLVDEATRMGGQGVINIEFLDENPSTDYERASSASQSMSNMFAGSGGPTQKERYVTVSGEVVQFLE